MSDNQKYYYIRLKDNFFDNESIILLESMPDGYLYSNILLKLYLRSLKGAGKLMVNNCIPYNSTMLSQITRHPVAVVEKALQLFIELGLIEILDNGAIYMLNIQEYIGQSSSEADRIKKYRAQIKDEKKLTCTNVQQKYTITRTKDRDKTTTTTRTKNTDNDSVENANDESSVVVRGLISVGVDKDVADGYIHQYGMDRVSEVLAAARHQAKSNPPAWIDMALRQHWVMSAAPATKAIPDYSESYPMAQDYVAQQYHETGDPSWSCPSDYPAHGRIGSPYGMVTLERAMQLQAVGGDSA